MQMERGRGGLFRAGGEACVGDYYSVYEEAIKSGAGTLRSDWAGGVRYSNIRECKHKITTTTQCGDGHTGMYNANTPQSSVCLYP